MTRQIVAGARVSAIYIGAMNDRQIAIAAKKIAVAIRDWQAPCDVYEPIEIPMDAEGHGDCETDGHFLCAEGTSVCALISRQALRRRRDICEEHGVKLIGGDHCPISESVPSVLAPTTDAA